jgi:glycosyltransferase involved in cell wall biosynthesis
LAIGTSTLQLKTCIRKQLLLFGRCGLTLRVLLVLPALQVQPLLLSLLPLPTRRYQQRQKTTGASMQSQSKKIWLNMIIKNEAAIITRCLESVLPLISGWTICDTGSTDGTQQFILDFFSRAKIDGELHHHDWVNFGHNRNRALDNAPSYADYILIIDADDYLSVNADLPELTADAYMLDMDRDGYRYGLPRLIKNNSSWRWQGALHEYLAGGGNKIGTIPADTVLMISTTDGAREKNPRKYLDDAAILEKELQKEPNNPRNRFYLAQSYRDAGNVGAALVNYQIRAKMSGWDEETFYALYQIARLREYARFQPDLVIDAYLAAHRYRPHRAEPLHHLARYCERQRSILPMTDDILFVEPSTYGGTHVLS